MLSVVPLPALDGPATAGCGLSFLHQMADSLGRAIDARDPHTALHSEQVAEASLLLAREMGINNEECLMIHIAGHLHDIGKIGIPDAILLKEGPLTEPERGVMRRHPEIGAQIVAPVALCASPGGIADMIRHHHECFDGSGYPNGIAGGRIPLGSRIIAVADTYSALLQNRPYRPGTTTGRAIAEITACAGGQFDPEIVEIFLRCAHRGKLASIPGQAGAIPPFQHPDSWNITSPKSPPTSAPPTAPAPGNSPRCSTPSP